MKISNKAPDNVKVFKTKADTKEQGKISKWWLDKNEASRCRELLATVVFLKETQNYRQKQAAIYARMYGNVSLMGFIGSNISKLDNTMGLPFDRPTFNLVQSVIDTKVARIGQTKPAPVFLTNNADYKQRSLAKKLNNFIQGEIYATKSYEKATEVLRDAEVEGTGCLHVYESPDSRVAVERVLLTELFIDPNEGIYGDPRRLYRAKLVDRDVLETALANWKKSTKDSDKADDIAKDFKEIVQGAQTAYTDNSKDSSKTVSDLVLVVEAWSLPSGKDSGDGRHTIACSSGIVFDEEYTKDKFPFVFLHDSKRMLGFWSQGAAERLMGTQIEINSILFTISKAIKLVGVPRIFQEKGSKVNKAAHNNEIGTIIEYSGTKPSYEVAPCVPQELYDQLQRLINYGYQQEGVSQMQASSEKPAGLDSGEAIRTYDNMAQDRMATLSRCYDNVFIDLAYLITDKAKDICERTGKYSTVYPSKNGVKEIDLKKADLVNDKFVIQCFNMSSLPKDPAGRMQKVIEMIQGGMISIREGRRLLDYPDLQQQEMLANASEERILQYLDDIVESGKFEPPDPFMDLMLAKEIVVQYYNLYVSAKLEEDRAQMLRDWYSQVLALGTEASAPPQAPGMAPNGAIPPQASPQPLPSSQLVPNVNTGAA